MALKSPTGGANSKFTPQEALEPGTYPARVVRVLDLGLQPQIDFTTKEAKKPGHMISVTYELVDVFMKGEDGEDLEDKPRWLTDKDFVLHSMDSDLATSTKRMNAIDPTGTTGGDWSQVIGLACMVTVGNYKKKDGSLGDKVMNVTAARATDARRMPPLQNDGKFFDLDEPDLEFFNSLPKWVKEKILGNLGFQGSPLQALLEGKAAPEKKKDTPPPAAEQEPGEAEAESDDAPW